jgi:hypothetical protein
VLHVSQQECVWVCARACVRVRTRMCQCVCMRARVRLCACVCLFGLVVRVFAFLVLSSARESVCESACVRVLALAVPRQDRRYL